MSATSSLTMYDLPGPHTCTKAAALESTDPRMHHMLCVAAETQWPQAYTDDLYRHDLQRLEEMTGETMLWILTPTSTHLHPMFPTEREIRPMCDLIRWYSGEHRCNFYGPELSAEIPRFFELHNGGINEITWQRAIEIVSGDNLD